ncbi:MAG: riboflavin biosynthesis protein RibF [Armatimonadota bacterium]
MRVVVGIGAFQSSGRPVVLGHGTFDGLHRGHQAVVEAVRAVAAADGGEAVILTFDPHPLKVIAPALAREPFLLSTLDERIALFARAGIDTLIVARFDALLRELSAVQWLEQLDTRLHLRGIVASSSHTFGRNREGTAVTLEAWAAPRRIGVTIVPPVRDDGAIISSTAIRERLRAGDARTVAGWLGRWYTVTGVVVPGDQRGRQIGIPTANLRVAPDKVIPGRGVYAAYASVAGQTYKAAVNIGMRPTFGEGGLLVEAHLLAADVNLYGSTVELAFVERLRDERRFPTVDALKAQIAADITSVRRMLEIEPSIT